MTLIERVIESEYTDMYVRIRKLIGVVYAHTEAVHGISIPLTYMSPSGTLHITDTMLNSHCNFMTL
jgi:hypothetical protein